MRRINVSIHTARHSYEVLVGYGVIDGVATDLHALFGGRKCALVTDLNVRRLYGEKLMRDMKDCGLNVFELGIKPGERSKTIDEATRMIKYLSSFGFGRDSLIVALGGGVIGDLSGFVASIYMRGIPYVYVPTTLLSQVDSSIGGKTGVNAWGKNIIGTFYHPVRVYTDLKVLHTLPEKEIKNGLVEMIKVAIVFDARFFEKLEKHIEEIMALNRHLLSRAVVRAIKIKAEIVKKDPYERGLRCILNYGHTLAHAIETLSGYRITHGEAVAVGMRFAGLLAHEIGLWSRDELERQNRLLDRLDLPCTIPSDLALEDILRQMRLDKKNINTKISFVLPCEIGKAAMMNGSYRIHVDDVQLLKLLKSFASGNKT